MTANKSEIAVSAVCIAGAHRSGTSMVTRLLHSCGLELGSESDLMPARADNPDGFWENLRFVAINDEVLNELGGAWDLPPPQNETFKNKRLDSLRTKAQLLINEFDSAKVWGWKDPRNSLTLPFWRELLPALKILIVVRNPLEVAYSMRERNGTSYSFGLRLWEIYNRRLLEASEEGNRLLTHYDSFFENPKAELERVAQFLSLSPSHLAAAAELVTAKKRHTRFSTRELMEARVSPGLLALYRKLSAEAQRSDETDIRVSIEQIPPERGGRSEIKDGEILPGEASRLNVSIPEGETLRRQAMLELDKAQQELSRKEQEFRQRFLQINQLLHQKSISLVEHEARIIELTADLRRQLQATKKLARLLDDVDSAAARLRTSRRWKLANPIAALRAMLPPRKALLGYGHLEKIVSTYSNWRRGHPEVAEIDDAIQALNPRADWTVGRSNKERGRRLEPRVPTKPIEFPSHEEVEISIVIPVFNQFHFTQACLASIQEHQANERLEVIVVDDGSTDATAEVVSKLPGIIYLRNETNAGFIASCNRGAAKARGRFLVFLNNDIEVTSGWLSALRETFEIEPRAGLVGSKLIYPDGRLQEAGGIIWNDASGWNRGKYDDPEKPEYNFLREVDYCSGACVMIPKALFDTLGGFDSKYAPAYYEDVDLAFRVRQRGFHVFYQPTSEIIHYEGGTGGTDLSTGEKKYQEINRATFAETWADVLAEKPVNGDLAFYEQLASGKKRILVIDHHLPMPDRDAGSLRMFYILDILHGLGHRVTFVPDNLADIPPYAGELQKRGIEVIYHPYAKSVREYLEQYGNRFDIVILSRCDFAKKHIADVRLHAPQSRIVFDTVDLHFLRQNREANLTQDPLTRLKAEEKQQEEYGLIDQADETWVVSSFEQELLQAERPNKSIEIVSMIVETPGSATPFSLRQDFLFIGSFQHSPNIDAVLFFTKEIYPLVEQRLRGVKFYIIGDKAPPEVIALASENIVVTGRQPDVRPYFDSVKLSIAPLRFGAGVKGKINQSMGLGVPVVATSVAVEGMALIDGQDICIADAKEDFAEALIELYESEALWQRISMNGIEKTKSMYSAEAARKQLSHVFNDRHFASSCAKRTESQDIKPSAPSANDIKQGAVR